MVCEDYLGQHVNHFSAVCLADICWLRPDSPEQNRIEQDMIKNLRNVAIPGTGIPLSWHCFFKATVYILILILNPAMCLLSAINMQRKHGR